ncbi:MMPL family transporter [Bariatricus massiliensis]|uniref:MMPL family transporter n=1 Tax=Bariatricus massiliensis TaxID=1745713 RepID=A0ABS8DJM2_9FIRM|nr:MMPL family transporter [Bariatricus massiliensis]MCB7304940.1 MMPL family transporter [Bariatricus massiliensis]MCB7375494.1 MMPL family transporter [Bariatricus massiliensis]MCB7387954.1 MMPL family transporter [Bariatricus massiliensis]MCB7412226.1 MMPL family transporter [Bariatricus massiliensis]MCQ5253311.1 MMPL family transporter [Bariatricus massiliensis]
MVKIGKKIVKYRVVILILGFLLLIPSALGYFKTRVNYDILYYLPDNIETMKGQDILMKDFGKGAFAMEVVEGMNTKEVSDVKKKIEGVDGVAEVIWYDSLADTSLPINMLPDKLKEVFNTDNATLMAIFFDDTTSADSTMDAITEIRQITNKQCYLSSMSAVVTDIKALSEKETPVYVLIAVILTCIVLSIFMDCWILPVFFMLSIGMAIIYNMGSNYFLGEISYITKALSAVLQLGVTMDYSIFLWHSYQENQQRFPGEKERAMAHAISNTFSSVVGSSITTVAGFIALCFMSFTLGKDLGIVMAKGVVFGVLSCVTILPSFILVFDKAIQKTTHRSVMPSMEKPARFITKHFKIFVAAFLIILFPALWGYSHAQVYYNLDATLPKTLDSIKANDKLSQEFDMNATHMVLADASLSSKDAKAMLAEMQDVKGVKFALGLDSLLGSAIPRDMIPGEVTEALQKGDWQLILVQSEYKVATDQVNKQCTELNKIIKKYDSSAMLIGEAPCTKDLITITDKDFKVVSAISIIAIFLIIAIVFKSFALPVILVSVIEFAIFINLGIPFYTGVKMPFIASIVIGTIQLGATVDYAILMTTRYKKERGKGKSKQESIQIALSTSISSVIVSALGFFAATFGVGLYSDIDMISALCTLMARGAIISMVTVIFILPSMLMVFDKVICATTMGMKLKLKHAALQANANS